MEREPTLGPWVLVAPRQSAEALRPLLEARSAEREVFLYERARVPDVSEWPALVPAGAAAVLLVGDPRRAPATVLAGPFVSDESGQPVPSGWLPATVGLGRAAEATVLVGLRTTASPVAVLAQRSPRYQRLSARLVHHLDGTPSLRWGAERLTREDLVDGLGTGLGPVVYLGHGRPSGWAAYRGLRAEHLAAVAHEPMGCVMSVTCWTASRKRVGTSFSERIVLEGTAASALGAIRPVEHLANTRVVVALARTLQAGVCDVAGLLRGTFLQDGRPTTEAAGFRLCGDPLSGLRSRRETASKAAAIFAPPPDLESAAL
jgi:hypothetical protein